MASGAETGLAVKEVPLPASAFGSRDAVVEQEYDRVRGQRCSCGGAFTVVRSELRREGEKHYDALFCRCSKCNARVRFDFDISTLIQEWKFAKSFLLRKRAGRFSADWCCIKVTHPYP